MSHAAPDTKRDLGGLLEAGAVWLQRRGVPDSARLCQWLAAHILDVPRLKLPLVLGRELCAGEVDALRDGIVRLGRHEPIQYVIGEWDFRGHVLKVDARALIPRPETEQLVQLLIDTPEVWRAPAPRVCDVGTGSGCIVVSLALERPEGSYLATDIEPAALALAGENAARLAVTNKIEFVQGHSCATADPASLDALITNPPYIATARCATLEPHIREFEPTSALDGGSDGLDIIRDIIFDAALRLKPQGWCFMEIGAEQGQPVSEMMRRAGFRSVEVRRDLGGRDRHVRARMP